MLKLRTIEARVARRHALAAFVAWREEVCQQVPVPPPGPSPKPPPDPTQVQTRAADDSTSSLGSDAEGPPQMYNDDDDDDFA